MQTFYIQFENYDPIDINTLYNDENERIIPLTTISHLIRAFKIETSPLLKDISLAQLNLYLPEMLDKSSCGLEEEYFKPSLDSLRIDLSIQTLIDLKIGLDFLNPLILRTNKLNIKIQNETGIIFIATFFINYLEKTEQIIDLMDVDNFDWQTLSSIFNSEFKPFEKTYVTVASDRLVKFSSTTLDLYQSGLLKLEDGNLPRLRFQNFNIETPIQKSVEAFMVRTEILGVLIGPTGCGKTHELLNCAKKDFAIFIDAQSSTSVKNDISLMNLMDDFYDITNEWGYNTNQDLSSLRRIAFAYVLSRMLFLKFLKEKYPSLSPTEFLIHQMFNSRVINHCYLKLKKFQWIL